MEACKEGAGEQGQQQQEGELFLGAEVDCESHPDGHKDGVPFGAELPASERGERAELHNLITVTDTSQREVCRHLVKMTEVAYYKILLIITEGP